jgi:hypothetical protein
LQIIDYYIIDRQQIEEERDWQDCYNGLRKRVHDPTAAATTKQVLNHMLPFPRTLESLVARFAKEVSPFEPDCNVLWGLFELNLKARRGTPNVEAALLIWK